MVDIDPLSHYYRINLYNGVHLAYIDCSSDASPVPSAGQTIVLLHGFPQTSYQYRRAIPILVKAGYRIIAPDYRGAGESSKPINGFTKAIMAGDIIALLDNLEVDGPVHVVGHDMGGIIAYALASRWPERVATVCICECLLPGTRQYASQIVRNPVKYFHFPFHCVPNLPEALLQGRERTYVDYFINQLCYRIGSFSPEDVNRYALSLCQPGSLRCALDIYRALEQDAEDTMDWIARKGKCQVPCMLVNGEFSSYGEHAYEMAEEVVSRACLDTATIERSGHFIAEENPVDFSVTILAFLRRHTVPS